MSRNMASGSPSRVKELLSGYMHARGQKCFDYDLYKQANLKDLAKYKKKGLW